MESWEDFCSKLVIENIIHYLTGSTCENSSVVKISSENLAVNGELYFINNFNAWKSLVICDRNCATILQHFIHTHDSRKNNIDADISEEVNKPNLVLLNPALILNMINVLIKN